MCHALKQREKEKKRFFFLLHFPCHRCSHIIMLIHRFMMLEILWMMCDAWINTMCRSLKSSRAIKENIKYVTREINNTLNLSRDRVPVISYWVLRTCLWQRFLPHQWQRHCFTFNFHIAFLKHNKILWHWNSFHQIVRWWCLKRDESSSDVRGKAL